MFKFFFRAKATELLHTWKHLMGNLIIPICAACCFIIILCYNIKTSFAIEWHKTSEVRNGELYSRYGLQDYGINLICGPVQFDRWVNAFKFIPNASAESTGSSAKGFVTIEGETNQYRNKSAANTKKPEIGGGEVKTENYHVLFSLIPMWIIALWIFFRELFFT